MDVDPLQFKVSQPTLFSLGDSSSGVLELFPAVWSAAEALTHPDVATRRAGLERLGELGAIRLSPLVSYLVSTRLTDADLDLRARVVILLAEVLSPDREGNPAPESVRAQLTFHLAQMRSRRIYALLQVVEHSPAAEAAVMTLLNACPYGGSHLMEILSNRKAPIAIRKWAAYFTGRVGYIDAIQGLERILSRLAARVNGQQAMPFAPPSEPDESSLLPAVQEALALLRSP